MTVDKTGRTIQVGNIVAYITFEELSWYRVFKVNKGTVVLLNLFYENQEVSENFYIQAHSSSVIIVHESVAYPKANPNPVPGSTGNENFSAGNKVIYKDGNTLSTGEVIGFTSRQVRIKSDITGRVLSRYGVALSLI